MSRIHESDLRTDVSQGKDAAMLLLHSHRKMDKSEPGMRVHSKVGDHPLMQTPRALPRILLRILLHPKRNKRT